MSRMFERAYCEDCGHWHPPVISCYSAAKRRWEIEHRRRFYTDEPLSDESVEQLKEWYYPPSQEVGV